MELKYLVREQENKKILTNAIDTILDGGTLENKKIVLENGIHSVINSLAYGCKMKIPANVRNWIDGSLESVEMCDGQATRYACCGKPSTAFPKYMNELIANVKAVCRR